MTNADTASADYDAALKACNAALDAYCCARNAAERARTHKAYCVALGAREDTYQAYRASAACAHLDAAIAAADGAPK